MRLVSHSGEEEEGGNYVRTILSGQLFAVALNVAYLIPLIYLFVSFYIRSYKKKAAAKGAKIQ